MFKIIGVIKKELKNLRNILFKGKKVTRVNAVSLIEENPFNIKYMENEPLSITLLAIRKIPQTLAYVEHQADIICLTCVKLDGLCLKYVHNQTEEICKEAIKQNPKAIMYVNDENLRKKIESLAS